MRLLISNLLAFAAKVWVCSMIFLHLIRRLFRQHQFHNPHGAGGDAYADCGALLGELMEHFGDERQKAVTLVERVGGQSQHYIALPDTVAANQNPPFPIARDRIRSPISQLPESFPPMYRVDDERSALADNAVDYNRPCLFSRQGTTRGP